MSRNSGKEPVLHRSDVATLRQYLCYEQDYVMAANSATDAEAAEYVQGIQYALDALETMWRAAVIASEAHARALAAERTVEEC